MEGKKEGRAEGVSWLLHAFVFFGFSGFELWELLGSRPLAFVVSLCFRCCMAWFGFGMLGHPTINQEPEQEQ
jgi:hypothetical protein